jgi:hydrogenase small subunit
MRIHRRQFLKYCLGSAATLGLPLTVAGKLEKALADDTVQLPKVIWLNGANCTGCTVSLANRFSDGEVKDVADLLLNYIDLVFHPNLMAAAGDLAVEQLEAAAGGDYILAVDGGIPTAFDGHTCLLWTDSSGHEVTAMEAVNKLAPNAAAILSIGTCASFGGIPAGNPNPTGIVSVGEIIGKQTINLSGCPTHPDWIVWTVANLLAGVIPRLDGVGRPAELYHGAYESIHKVCPRKGLPAAKTFGQDNTCLKGLGCRGPQTRSDCPGRKWNNGTNWCIGANAICIGCTEAGFPDKFSPFYKIEYAYQESSNPGDEDNPDPGDGVFNITKAEWNREKSELKVEGKGRPGSIVSIKDDSTGAALGAVSVSAEAKWRFRQHNPKPLPSRVRAQSNGVTASRNVIAKIAEDAGELEIKKAEWKQDREILKVEGTGLPGASVEISNPTRFHLGTVTVNSEGKWKLELKNQVSAPDLVQAASNSQVVIKPVKID